MWSSRTSFKRVTDHDEVCRPNVQEDGSPGRYETKTRGKRGEISRGEILQRTLLDYCLVEHVDIRSLDIFASVLLERSQSVPDAAKSALSGLLWTDGPEGEVKHKLDNGLEYGQLYADR